MWEVRSYHPTDEAQLVQFFGRLYPSPVSADFWRWKLKSLPVPAENVWLACSDERIIFHYAGIPLTYYTPDGVCTGMVSVDTLTDPEYRRQGLLTRVGAQVYEAWEAAGVSFVIGLPNQKWGSRTAALGWQSLFPLRWLYLPLHLQDVVAGRLDQPFLKRFSFPAWLWRAYARLRLQTAPGLTIQAVETAGEAFDELWQQCAPEASYAVLRDRHWVQWRFLDAPELGYRVLLAQRQGRPAGYLAYRIRQTKHGREAVIAEVFAPRADMAAQHGLLRAALEDFYAARAWRIVTLAAPGNWIDAMLRRVGFLPDRHAFEVMLRPLASGLSLARLSDPAQWFISGADFDVV